MIIGPLWLDLKTLVFKDKFEFEFLPWANLELRW
jgi:hypothetical protein